jgi:hypothetical protein
MLIDSSTVGVSGLSDQKKLLKPLAETPGFITYIPPSFSPGWNLPLWMIHDEQEKANWESRFDPRYKEHTKSMFVSEDEMRKSGVGVTIVNCGIFEEAFFDWA